MKKILLSLAIIGAVGAVVAGVTTAYFSDTETSAGNTFTAGSIDLLIDNKSYAIDYTIPDYPYSPTGALVESPNNSWEASDLDTELFFSFVDLKPGDIGEDTISVRVDHNDAWACTYIEITKDSDNTCVDPEIEYEGGGCNEADPFDGELAQNLEFIWWPDDGDNVLEEDEALKIPPIFRVGGLPGGALIGIPLDELEGQVMTLSDSQYNFFTGAYDPAGGIAPLEGKVTEHVGKAWCLGEMEVNPLSEDTTNPTIRSNSIICHGEEVNNDVQTDLVEGDLTFYAVQARNNPDFQCVRDWNPSP